MFFWSSRSSQLENREPSAKMCEGFYSDMASLVLQDDAVGSGLMVVAMQTFCAFFFFSRCCLFLLDVHPVRVKLLPQGCHAVCLASLSARPQLVKV